MHRSKTESSPQEVKAQVRSAYSQAMDELLESRLFTDVTFVVEGEGMRAHRAILSARCETFRAMFTSGMAESEPGDPVMIADCTARAFRGLLGYLYTDSVSAASAAELMELLELADRYLLEDLRSQCDTRLACRTPGTGEVASLLSFAHTHNAPKLKEACIAAVMARHDAFDLSDLDKDLVIEMFRVSCSRKCVFARPPPLPSSPCLTHAQWSTQEGHRVRHLLGAHNYAPGPPRIVRAFGQRHPLPDRQPFWFSHARLLAFPPLGHVK